MRWLVFLLMAGCTVIHITPPADKNGQLSPVNVQTTDSVNILGSQNVTSADKATRGTAHGDLNTNQEATSVPVIPITAPISFP